jgi:hypothetical protein
MRRLLLRWTLIGLGFAAFIGVSLAVVFSPALSLWAVQWFTYDRHFQLIRITATPDQKRCPNEPRRIFVQIRNGSSRRVVESSFYLNAYRAGRAVDLSNGGEWSADSIQPGGMLGICAPAVLLADAVGEDPKTFLWSAGLSWVRFGN